MNKEEVMEVTVGFDPTLIADVQTVQLYGRQMSVSDATRHRERRLADLKHIGGLGWKISRYYVDTELVGMNKKKDWSCIDPVMELFEEIGHQPYFEFFHHILPFGLTYADPDLPERTTEFALAFAERYPWTRKFCIVNELLCSTLFSGLYAIWPPYSKDMTSFIIMLINAQRTNLYVANALAQVREGVEFMYPDTCEFHIALHPAAEKEVAFMNDRRFWGDDLARGLVGPGHSLYIQMEQCGLDVSCLEYFVTNPMQEKMWVRGLNCYTHSVKVLDEHSNHYTCPAPPLYTHVARQYMQRYPNTRWAIAETNLEGSSRQKAAWWGLVLAWAEELGVEECCYWSATDMSCWNTLCTQYNMDRVPTGLLHLRKHRTHGLNWTRVHTRFSKLFTQLCLGYFSPSEWPKDFGPLGNNERLRPYLPHIIARATCGV